jgi:hypothetical protein
VTTITFKPEPTFHGDDLKANLANAAKIKVSLPEDYKERDNIKAAIDRNENSDVSPELRIQAIAEGRSLPVPATLESRLHAVQVKIQSKNDALDYLAGKEKLLREQAQKRMVDEARPQIAAQTQALWDAFANLYEKYVPLWQARRHLHGNSVRTFELFNDSFEEFLGIPQGVNPAWSELFRQGIKAGHIRKMPAALAPKS